MDHRRCRFSFACIIFIVLLPIIASAAPIPRLQAPPLGERWFSISMNDERVGFAHTSVLETAAGYELFSEGSVKLKVMGVSRQSSAREKYQVGKDLALKSFLVEQTIDGRPMRLTGEVSGKTASVVIETEGTRKTKSLKVKNKLLPPPALNFYPPMQGAVAGKTYKVQMLDIEGVTVKGVEITVIGTETLPGGINPIHLQNDLYSLADNDIWVDNSGNTIQESVRDGLDCYQGGRSTDYEEFIAEAALAKKDMIFDFSLIRVEPPVKDPENLKKMVVLFIGFPQSFPLLQGAGQASSRLEDGTIQFVVAKPTAQDPNAPYDAAALAPYLEAREEIQADNGEIMERAKQIIGPERDRLQAAAKLNHWVAAEIKEAVTDSRSPLETMKNGEGNSQSHARLYISLARAAGIPSRLVSGLVHVKGKGFLYHSWAESYLGDWLATDPTFGQLPADATHIKLIEGDAPEDMARLATVVGKLKALVADQQY